MSERLDALLGAVPDGLAAVRLILSPFDYGVLVADPDPRVTLNGEDETIHHTYVRDYPERLVWHRTADGPWAWEVDRTALFTMMLMKHKRGIRLYRGVPVEMHAEGVTTLKAVRIADLAARG